MSLRFTCSQCHCRDTDGIAHGEPQPVLHIVVVRAWHLVQGRWQVELVDLLDPGELLCRLCARQRRIDGIVGADLRRKDQGKPPGSE